MNTEMTQSPHIFPTGLVRRIRYRHGVPFVIAVGLAVVTMSRLQPTRSTSIWTFALLALIATALTLLGGGRFRTFFIVIAVVPPFLFILGWCLRMRSAMYYLPIEAVGEYFLYFVAAPILLVWIVAKLSSREKPSA